MIIKPKLRELLGDGEGHTIWKPEPVLEALKENDITVANCGDYFLLKCDGMESSCPVTGAPKHKPKTKYDIVSWEGTKDDIGIYDLDFIYALVKLTGKKYTGRNCMGRGFQYIAYLQWLEENVSIYTPTEDPNASKA